MKICIAGAGNVGQYLIKMFSERNYDIILIDEDNDKIQEISSHYDIMGIQGSCASFPVLQQIEPKKVDVFISVTNSQDTNILSCIYAKDLGIKKTIARISEDYYLEKTYDDLIKNKGIDHVVFPEILAAEDIIRHLFYPNILKSVTIEKGQLELVNIKIFDNEDFHNKSLKEIANNFKDFTARIVAIQRNGETIIPYGDNKIYNGDIIYVLTGKDGKELIMKRLGIQDTKIKSVMILGGSKIGVNIAKRLEKDFYVKIFEKSKEKSFQLSDILDETLVLHSEARDSSFLLDEGISRTDVFIAVTGNSEINMLSCMLAKKLGVKKTFAEVENIDYLDIVLQTDIDFVINKKLIAASKIFTYVADKDIQTMTFLTDTNAEVLEFITHKNAKITKHPLKELNFPKFAIIGGIMRGNEMLIATGNTHIREGDRVIVFSLHENSEKLKHWFK